MKTALPAPGRCDTLRPMGKRWEPEHGERADPQRPDAALLVAAYCRGIFPMAGAENGRVEWFSPDPRGVIPLDEFHVPKSLERVVRSGRFEITTDLRFEAVMRLCSARRETWIDERLVEAYCELARSGAAHSLEAWRGGELVGGLYGVHLGAAFFGESMFSRPERGGRDASKVCLVRLVQILRARGFGLLDTQFVNEHLARFGCRAIPRSAYLRQLAVALAREADWPEPGPLREDEE